MRGMMRAMAGFDWYSSSGRRDRIRYGVRYPRRVSNLVSSPPFKSASLLVSNIRTTVKMRASVTIAMLFSGTRTDRLRDDGRRITDDRRQTTDNDEDVERR
ncbi:hypothetical protein AA313_de0204430 [Arthrobotrys entomopaga]|nr:hypothetical protein AA313_de0204430 [Arthrobotrys entomopaga]